MRPTLDLIRFTALALGLQACCAVAATPAAQSGAPLSPAAASFEVVTELDKAIWRVFQDSKGTYWFGSHEHGLYRRDATAFAHFTTASGLCSDAIGTLQEDKSGRLYIGTTAGISRFDGRTFSTLALDDSDTTRAEWKLEPDDLWFPGGQDTGVVYRYDGRSLRKLKFPPTAAGDANLAKYPRSKFPNAKYSPYDVYTVYKDRRGNVWFGTSSLGACRYDGKSFAWLSEAELGFDEKNDQSFGTRSLIEDRDGKFWITVTRQRFDVYPSGSAEQGAGELGCTKTAGLAHRGQGVDEDYTYIISMARDRAGDLWMATYSAGVWRYDGENLTKYSVLVDGRQITVFSIYCDRQGGLWLGTHEHGAFRFDGKSFEQARF
ncbi:MAG: hypothetical protein IPJ19_19780 [Planctomycetes bacterium]|nr:hypothetical protein [Planctomycetota bacterium]